MTKEELLKMLEGDDGKAVFSEVIAELGYKSSEDIKGLENKNRELLGANRKLKDEFTTFRTQYEGIDLDEYRAALDSKSKGNANANDVELRKIKQQLETIAKEKDDYRTKLESSTKRSAIHSAIGKAGFDPRYSDALYAMFDNRAKVQPDERGNYSVIVDDGTSVDSIEDYVTKYAKSEAGKAYLPAPDHRGAHSKQYSGSQTKTMKRSDFEALSGLEKNKAGKEYQIID